MVDGQPDLFAALQWRYQFSPTLRGRVQSFEDILNWADDGANTISVRLLTGGGGSGKTRLAAEVARALRHRGWATGFVPRKADSGQTIETDLRKIFLVFDYPEERPDTVRDLVRRIRDIPNDWVDFPIRILFVSRRAFADWKETALALGPRFGRHELADLSALSVEDAGAIFEETGRLFSETTGRAAPDNAWVASWFEVHAGRRVPLAAMAAAIHQVMSGRPGFDLGAPDVIEALAEYERQRVADHSRALGLGAEGLGRLLGLAALTPTGLSERVLRDLAEAEAVPIKGQALVDALRDCPWWRRRDDTHPPEIVRPEPDRMAAVFAAFCLLEQPSQRLPDWIALPAAPQGGAFGDVISRIGYDLFEAKRRWFAAIETALAEMLDRDPARIVQFLDSGMRQGTVFTASFSVEVLTRALSAPELDDETRAAFANNLANFLSELGRREDALAAAEEAVTLRRTLAEAPPDAFLPDLAGSLNNLASSLSDLGRREDALAVAEEAVTLYRTLAEAPPDAFLPNLATSLNTLANRLSDLGRREDALAAAEEAVTFYRTLAEARPDAFLPDLSMSLGALTDVFLGLERKPEALASITEAITVLQPMFVRYPTGVARWMRMHLQRYIQLCEDRQQEPDMALLGPLIEIFERLNTNNGKET